MRFEVMDPKKKTAPGISLKPPEGKVGIKPSVPIQEITPVSTQTELPY